MSGQVAAGDVRVVSDQAGTDIFVRRRGTAEIWTGAAWRALRAGVAVSQGAQLEVQVRVSPADLAGLPYPTGRLTVVSTIAGWQGSVSVSPP
jgi:hypothetical protein